jgi:hypothetical protein
MSLREDLENFNGSINLAIGHPPDDYPEWSYVTYDSHMADLKALWAAIRPRLKRDLIEAEQIDGKLAEMFTAFDAGEKERGRSAALFIYNMEPTRLR